MQVVDGVELGAEHLAAAVEMMQIGAGEMPAGVAGAAGVKRPGVVPIAAVAQPQQAGGGEQMAVAGVAGGHHAVEHINAVAHRMNDVGGGAHPHQIAGRGLRQLRAEILHHLPHLLLRLPHRQPADGIAGEANIPQSRQRGLPKIAKHRPLHDAEQSGGMVGVSLLATGGPTHREFHRGTGPPLIRRIGRALIKSHNHIRPQSLLHRHSGLRPQKDLRPIHRRTKPHPLLADPHLGVGGFGALGFGIRGFGNSGISNRLVGLWPVATQIPQTEHLKTPRVGKQRLRPPHKPMQPTMPLNNIGARPQHQMEGVTQRHLRPSVGELLRRKPLDRPIGAHRHKSRRMDDAASKMQPPTTSLTVRSRNAEPHGGGRCVRCITHRAGNQGCFGSVSQIDSG